MHTAAGWGVGFLANPSPYTMKQKLFYAVFALMLFSMVAPIIAEIADVALSEPESIYSDSETPFRLHESEEDESLWSPQENPLY